MRNIFKIALVPVLFGAGLTALATAAAADIRINIGPPAYYYAPPPPYYYGPGPSCYWDSMAGRVCTY